MVLWSSQGVSNDLWSVGGRNEASVLSPQCDVPSRGVATAISPPLPAPPLPNSDFYSEMEAASDLPQIIAPCLSPKQEVKRMKKLKK